MTASPTLPRIVPGAAPPIELSKSQKKKRKVPKADDAVSPAEHPEFHEPPGLVSRIDSALPDEEQKSSLMVDMMNRRLKAIAKKIGRISTYASTDIEKLNDDQVRSLKNLPTLEAIQKELTEVKKAIETHEQEQVHELVIKRAEAEMAEKVRISNAVSEAEASLFTRFSDVLTILRLHSLVATGSLDISSLADSSEISALFSLCTILIGESEQRQSIVEQIVRGMGDFEGTPYARLLVIAYQALNPREPSPILEEEPVEEERPASPSVEDEEDDTQPPVTGIPMAASMSGSFQFIQQSEIEATSIEAASEWVDATVPGTEPEATAFEPEPILTIPEVPENGNGTIDWADEEGGLPPIAGLLGTSGSATPAEAEKAAPPEGPAAESSWQAHGANGDAHAAGDADDDGFTPTKGRARGRGARGERGFRGRGGERGSHRGGERGGYRGGRGGDRGGGSGFRGGREWRGDGERARDGDGDGERGDGERHREGGRGRGGGGYGRGRGGEGGRGRGGEGGRGRGDRGRGERRGGRGDRGGHHHHHEAAPASAFD